MTTVTACIDASPSAPCVATASAWASQRLAAPLRLLHVLEKPPAPATQDFSGSIGLGSREQLLAELTELDARRERLAMEHGKHLLEDAERLIAAAGVAAVEKRQRHGSLLATLQDMAADTRLLVMGRVGEGHDIAARTIGSHLESVVRSVHRPILVVMQRFKQPQRFMIAWDGSETAGKALDMVAGSPLLAGLPCHLVTAGPVQAEQATRLEAGRQRLREAGFEVIAVTLEGEVDKVLRQYYLENDIDLLVMGAWGHSRIRQFFVGSNTTRMLSHGDLTLLLLR